MDYTEDDLIDLIARHNEHEEFYRGKMADLNAKHDDAVIARTAADIVTKVRANCTLPSELVLKGGDQIIYAVADWIENPPEWVKASWRDQEPSDVGPTDG